MTPAETREARLRHFPNVQARVEALQAELRDSWGKPASYVAERERELADLLRIYAGEDLSAEELDI